MPEYPPAALSAASAAIERELMSGTEYGCHIDSEDALARVALDAAAPLLAEACARAIIAHMEANGPKPNGAGRRAWRRQFGIAARVAAGCFSAREEKLRQVAEAIAAGNFTACDPEAALASLAEREGIQITGPEDMAACVVRSAVSDQCQWGHHDQCCGITHAAPGEPGLGRAPDCACPRHQDPSGVCWGDIARVQVRRG